MQIRPFDAGDVAVAGRLLADRHRREQVAEPLLPRRFADPDLCAEVVRRSLDIGAAGSIAEDAGRIIGYLLATRGDDLRGRHVWSGLEHHALATDADPEVVRQLYTGLAEQWVDDGRLHHYAVVPVVDVDPWLALAFSHEQVHALRGTASAAANLSFPIRKAGPADVDAVQPVARLIADANVASPVFAYVGEDFYDEIRPSTAELIEDETVDYWIAESADEIVGFTATRPVPRNEDSMLKPAGSVELIVAATSPNLRGTGIGGALCRHALAAAAERGFEVCVTDWRAANVTASVFWPRRGFRAFAYRLHRLIDPRVRAS